MSTKKTKSTRLSRKSSISTLLLLSGGIDSAACAHFLLGQKFDVRCLYIDYGQKAAVPEIRAARRISRYLDLHVQVERLKFRRRFDTGEHVGRNAFLVFSALMASDMGRGLIALGIHSGTRYYDCSTAFLERIDTVIQEYTRGRVQLLAPLIDWNKEDIIDYCLEKNLPLRLTYSCEAGTMPPCGKCVSCKDRKRLKC